MWGKGRARVFGGAVGAGGAYFTFRLMGGELIRGGANSRISVG